MTSCLDVAVVATRTQVQSRMQHWGALSACLLRRSSASVRGGSCALAWAAVGLAVAMPLAAELLEACEGEPSGVLGACTRQALHCWRLPHSTEESRVMSISKCEDGRACEGHGTDWFLRSVCILLAHMRASTCCTGGWSYSSPAACWTPLAAWQWLLRQWRWPAAWQLCQQSLGAPAAHSPA